MQTVRETKSYDQYGADSPPFQGTLAEVIAGLQALHDALPAEYRTAAMIDIDAYDDYGSPRAQMTISYDRPETPDETYFREAKEKGQNAQAEARERAEFNRLAAKYGDPLTGRAS